jgi:hypothetical protein
MKSPIIYFGILFVSLIITVIVEGFLQKRQLSFEYKTDSNIELGERKNQLDTSFFINDSFLRNAHTQQEIWQQRDTPLTGKKQPYLTGKKQAHSKKRLDPNFNQVPTVVRADQIDDDTDNDAYISNATVQSSNKKNVLEQFSFPINLI